ncbi:MAG TPA: carboxypeptidase-like regulatory domain-containing protein [Candidatus Solibacter sp.]|nr:carboxypeptidase-like regulatory domain-containing protein [Candidatus Solibacter sp.]
MIVKLRFLAAFALMLFLPLAAAKDSKPGGVSGRLAIRTPDGREISGDKVKAYLLYNGGGKMEIKESCVNSRCKKRAFLDGREVDITGLETDQEIYAAMKTPAAFYNNESSQQMKQWMDRRLRPSDEELKAILEGREESPEAENKKCLDGMGIYERALAATEKWAADRRKSGQFFTAETSQEGKFTFTAVPAGNYYFVASGAAAEYRVIWHGDVEVKSGKDTTLDAPKVLTSCPKLK